MNDNYNYLLFKKVWGNLIIKNEILFHLRLFNIHLNKRIEIDIKELIKPNLETYKYKSYIDKIYLTNYNEIYKNEIDEYDDNTGLLIEKVGIEIYELKANLLSSSIRDVIIGSRGIKLVIGGLSESITSLKIICKFQQILLPGHLPNSITNLEFSESSFFNQSLSGNWLPRNNIKSLLLYSFNKNVLISDNLPKSLTRLEFNKWYNSIIEPLSIPCSVTSLNFKFNSIGNTLKFNSNNVASKIPRSTINIEFDDDFNQDITTIPGTKNNYFPNNIQSIKFGKNFNGTIQINSIPQSCTSLNLGSNSNKQQIKDNILPLCLNLKNIELSGTSIILSTNLFPLSIESIKFHSFNNEIPIGYFYKFNNLKYLDLGNCFNNQIPSNSLPESLTFLKILNLDNNILNVNYLPSSLLILDIFNIKKPIENQHKLPSSLTQLIIRDPSFNDSNLSFDTILPQSIQSIYISPICQDFINSLNLNFFLKYIKFNSNLNFQ